MKPPELLHQIERLNDVLAASNDDVALYSALEYVLYLIQRPAGMLLVQTPGANTPSAAYDCNIPEAWRLDPRSGENNLPVAIRQAVHQALHNQEPVFRKNGNGAPGPAAAIPLVYDSQSQGVLLIHGSELSWEEQESLSHLARAIGRAIHTRQLHSHMGEQRSNLKVLQEFTGLLNSNVSPDALQAQILRKLSEVLDAEIGSLLLRDKDNRHMLVKQTPGENMEWVYQVSMNAENGLIAECIRSKQPILVRDTSRDARFDPGLDGIDSRPVHSMLCAPIFSQNEVKGAVVVYNKRSAPFNELDLDLLITFTDLIAYIIYDIDVVRQLRVASAELEVNRWRLLHSRNTLLALFDNIPLSFYIIDSDYNLKAINSARSKRTGLRPNQLVGKRCYQALYGRNEPCPACLVNLTLLRGQITQRLERVWHESNEMQEWEISSYPIRNDAGTVIQVILSEQDITEKHRLENQLIQSEKLAVVGQLAAGVAHEINNPLTAVIANAQIAQRALKNDPRLSEILELIVIAGNRAAQVVRNLLDLARKDHYEFLPLDINQTIEKALALINHELTTQSVELQFTAGQNLPRVKLSAEHIHGVWTNLILNAVDALKNRQKKGIRVQTILKDDTVIVTIADNGIGIAPDKLTHIFDPFYTTKEIGHGTGLGLTLCQRIIQQHGGHIDVVSEIDRGTEFTIHFPLT